MIFLEQTVNQILMEEGQVIISLEDLQITWESLENLFIGVAEQAAEYISIYDWVTDYINSTPTEKNWLNVKHITYTPVNYMQRMMPDVPGNYWEFNPFTKKASSMINTNFSLEVQLAPTIEHLQYSKRLNLIKDRKQMFTLPCTFSPESFSFGEMTAYPDYKHPHRIILECDNGVGCFDEKTLSGYVIMDKDYRGTLNITSKYVGIKELDLSCELFYTWFKGAVLCYIGAMKKQLDLTGVGLPFDLNGDTILERGRQLIDKVEELKGTKSHWSNF